jgi:hypothetical protein
MYNSTYFEGKAQTEVMRIISNVNLRNVRLYFLRAFCCYKFEQMETFYLTLPAHPVGTNWICHRKFISIIPDFKFKVAYIANTNAKFY